MGSITLPPTKLTGNPPAAVSGAFPNFTVNGTAIAAGSGIAVAGAVPNLTISNTGRRLLDLQAGSPLAVFSNSIAENTLYTFTVPAGTLTSPRVLRATFDLESEQTGAVSLTVTYRIKFGADVLTLTYVANPNAQVVPIRVFFTWALAGAVKRMWAEAYMVDGFGSANIPSVHGAGAADPTLANTLAVTSQMSVASVSRISRSFTGVVELA